MILYHGSPRKLKVLKPKQAKGINGFETQKAIFLCKTFEHAALYAISKSLKRKTIFAVAPKRLIIVGKNNPKAGYVYEIDIVAKKGPRGQYSYDKEIRNFKIKKVYPKDYKDKIVYVDNISELKKRLR